MAHGLTVTPDEKSVFVASYISSYIAKIDTATDTVTKVWDVATLTCMAELEDAQSIALCCRYCADRRV